ALIEVLPRVLDSARVSPDEQRDDVLLEVARHRQLAAVQRRVAEAVEPVLGRQLERDEVAARAADDHLAVDDLHRRATAARRAPGPGRARAGAPRPTAPTGSTRGIRAPPPPGDSRRG